MLDRLVDIYREVQPAFVLTHALEDPYNVDHPEATRFAQEARIIAQAAGHKPGPDARLRRAAGVPVRAAPARAVQLQAATCILNIDDGLGDQARRPSRCSPRRSTSGSTTPAWRSTAACRAARNSGRPMTYGEAYQRLFPMVGGATLA